MKVKLQLPEIPNWAPVTAAMLETAAWLMSDKSANAAIARSAILRGLTPPLSRALRAEWLRRGLAIEYRRIPP